MTEDTSSARSGFQQINEILAVPRFTRAELLSYTRPRIDSGQLTNWLRRGDLDLDRQAACGTADDFRAVADALKANEGQQSSRRRYTGGDVLKVMALQAIGQCGLPYSLSGEIIDLVLESAQNMLLHGPSARDRARLVIAVSTDARGHHRVRVTTPEMAVSSFAAAGTDDAAPHQLGDLAQLKPKDLVAAALRARALQDAADAGLEWCTIIDHESMVLRFLRSLQADQEGEAE